MGRKKHMPVCKLCHKLRCSVKKKSVEYRKQQQKYRDNNRELCNERARKSRYKKVEYYREKNRLYRMNNLEKHAAKEARRRALKREQTPELTSLEESAIYALYFISKVLSNSCDEQFHVDHIIPLAKGGLHTFENLQILTAKENLAKGARIEH
jgi:5-methylcytosine-specific restriction endonuclease McrA